MKDLMTSIDMVITPKAGNAETHIIMPGDYTPHQEYKLEDAEVAPQSQLSKKLDELIKKYDCIVSKHINDINTTPLLKMEIETEGPPIASLPYVLPLKHHSFVQEEIANLERAGAICKT